MSGICDRSPCDALLGALGDYIFGSTEGFYVVTLSYGREKEVPVEYCLFCGTRLLEVPAIMVEKFTRPRRRRRQQRHLQT